MPQSSNSTPMPNSNSIATTSSQASPSGITVIDNVHIEPIVFNQSSSSIDTGENQIVLNQQIDDNNTNIGSTTTTMYQLEDGRVVSLEHLLAMNTISTSAIATDAFTTVGTDVEPSTDTPSLHLLAYKISSLEKQFKELKGVVNDGFASIIRILSANGNSRKAGTDSAPLRDGKSEIQRLQIIKSVEELQEFNTKLEDRAYYEYVVCIFRIEYF